MARKVIEAAAFYQATVESEITDPAATEKQRVKTATRALTMVSMLATLIFFDADLC